MCFDAKLLSLKRGFKTYSEENGKQYVLTNYDVIVCCFFALCDRDTGNVVLNVIKEISHQGTYLKTEFSGGY